MRRGRVLTYARTVDEPSGYELKRNAFHTLKLDVRCYMWSIW